MFKVVGYWPIKTRKGEDAFIVAYVGPMGNGQRGGYGMRAGEQFVTKAMFDDVFGAVPPDKVVGLEGRFLFDRNGFLSGIELSEKKA